MTSLHSMHPSQFCILRLVLDLCNLIIRLVLDPCITRFHRFKCKLDVLELLEFRGVLVSLSDLSLRLHVCRL